MTKQQRTDEAEAALRRVIQQWASTGQHDLPAVKAAMERVLGGWSADATRSHPDDVVKAASDLAGSMGYGITRIEIQWPTGELQGDTPPRVKYGYWGDDK